MNNLLTIAKVIFVALATVALVDMLGVTRARLSRAASARGLGDSAVDMAFEAAFLPVCLDFESPAFCHSKLSELMRQNDRPAACVSSVESCADGDHRCVMKKLAAKSCRGSRAIQQPLSSARRSVGASYRVEDVTEANERAPAAGKRALSQDQRLEIFKKAITNKK